MARQIAPGTPSEIKAPQYKVDKPDWSMIDKMGDAQIQAANNNYKLYAEALITSESNKLYNQFKNDPINLANALGKLPEMLKDLPEEVQTSMNRKLYLNNVSLVQKAQNNQLAFQDAENKRNADYTIENTRQNILPAYVNLLQNNIETAEFKKPILNDIFLNNVDSLQTLSELKNSSGLDVYSDSQKKAIRNISDVELEGYKQFVDSMILNDNEDLEKTKAYYQQHVLAPERFMSENYMNRDTYDKARAYLEKQMKQAGADIKNMRFKQSVKEATELQMVDLPGRLQELRASGNIDSKILDNIEKANVKFNNIDPTKTELPTTMLETLEIVNSWSKLPEARTEEEKMATLAEGTAALDSIASFMETYGGTPKSVDQARMMVVMKEQDRVYGDMLDNFGRLTQSFGSEIPDMRKKMNFIRGVNGGNLKSMDYKVPTDIEMRKLGDLNKALAIAEDASREALRNGDMNSYYQTQQELRKTVAQIKYSDKIDAVKWAVWEKDPETIFYIEGVKPFQVTGFTQDGDIITKE